MKDLLQALMDGDSVDEVPTTAEMDRAADGENRKLVAHCDKCSQWWKFTRDMSPTAAEEVCPNCGGKPSHRTGFQITTQRSFNPAAKKMTKAQIKKMSMGA